MFLTLRWALVVLLICVLFGCGETEDVVLPEVTVGFVAYEGTDSAKFLLTAHPPTRELAVLVEFTAAGQQPFHRWEMIPKGASSLQFTVPLETSVSWDVSILRFWEKSTKDYPISGFGLSTDESFNGYVLGSPRRVTTQPFVVPDPVVPESVLEEPVLEGRMYWVEGMKIRRANLDGSNIQDLVTSSHRIERSNFYESIALDVAGGRMYWADKEKIRRANLDGSNIQDIYTTGGEANYIGRLALDVTQKKIYWINQRTIRRANLDGSNVEHIHTSQEYNGPHDIALDVAEDKLYWSTSNGFAGTIWRANLDGSNIQDLVSRRIWYPLTLVFAGGKLYWRTDDKIQCAIFDGAGIPNIQNIVTTGTDTQYGFAIAGGKLYWVDSSDLDWRSKRIRCANLDGSNIQDILTELDSADNIVLDVD